MTKKKKERQLHNIPLLLIIFYAVLSIVMIKEGIKLETTGETLPFVTYGGTFKYNDISIFGISLYWCLLIIGFVCAMLMAAWKCKLYNYSVKESLTITVFFAIFDVVFGPKIFFGIENALTYGDWSQLSFEGMSLFGALYFSLFMVPATAKIFKKDVLDMFDFVSTICLSVLVFTRTGCFFSGCCGAKWASFMGVDLRLPVQLFEVIGDLIILSVCLYIEEHRNDDKRYTYNEYPTMIIMYSVLRFLMEEMRDKQELVGIFTVSQIHCLFFFIVGLMMLRLFRKYSRKKAKKKNT